MKNVKLFLLVCLLLVFAVIGGGFLSSHCRELSETQKKEVRKIAEDVFNEKMAKFKFGPHFIETPENFRPHFIQDTNETKAEVNTTEFKELKK